MNYLLSKRIQLVNTVHLSIQIGILEKKNIFLEGGQKVKKKINWKCESKIDEK